MFLSTKRYVAGQRLGWLVAATALASLLGLGACSRKIGDACATSVDCDPNGGTRTCDLSQPGGYCLIEGCDEHSCPEDSFCVRSFPEALLKMSCSADSCSTCKGDPDCPAEELCLMDTGSDSGVCARRSWETRVCVQSCSSTGDCRGGYQCTATGVGGVLALTLTKGATPGFCAPSP